MLEVKNKKEFLKKLPYALWKGLDIVYNNKIVLNFIGATIYLDMDFIKGFRGKDKEELFRIINKY
ncbi:MAG: hypothetical protein B6D55_04695 [Candidatus Omnitrophica bacterium 4484_70.2]|nr:MAG: hypothetical protein B6D55_04695 [Candidatus Omnitrophica bacterium 4484_70.2]